MIAALHAAQSTGHPLSPDIDKDREVRRRMPTRMLVKVRSLGNATTA
jgi:hypothetical protein